MMRVLLIVLFILLGKVDIFAQEKHEFSFYGGGGLSTLDYKATVGEQKSGSGGNFGLGYTFFFTPNWGLGTGVEFSSYKAGLDMDNAGNLSVSYMTVDMEGISFEFRSVVNAYEEKQRTGFLQIPLMLQFQTDGRRQFYAAAGGKAGIPLNGKYRTTVSLSNSGYYAHENSLYDTQEFMGFGHFAGKKYEGELDFKTAYFLSVESGVKWRLCDKLSFYAGAYLDYGLNNINTAKDQAAGLRPHFVEYNRANPPAFAVNSAISAFTGKMTPKSAGIKLRLAFGM